MDAFKAQFERVKQQLSVLSATQKMLVTALVGVIVMTMLYWGHYAANQDMVPVMEMTLADEAMNPIVHFLDAHGINHTVSNGQVLVPADKKFDIISQLAYEELLPNDTRSAFEEMGKQSTMFQPESQHEEAFNHVTEIELAQMINRWEGVSHCFVKISPKSEVRVEGSIKPSASISFQCKANAERLQQAVQAAASNVAHAVSDLHVEDISVVVNGIARHVTGSDSSVSPEEGQSVVAKEEDRLDQNVLAVCGHIQNLMVRVTCDYENSTTETTEDIFNREKSIIEPTDVEENTTESSGGNSAQVPGIDPNTGANSPVSLDGSGGGGSSTSTTSQTHTKSSVLPGKKTIRQKIGAGKPMPISATVCVPRSYLINLFKARNPDISSPTEEQIAPLRTTELASLQRCVKSIAGLKNESDVVVSEYVEMPTEIASVPGVSATNSALNQVSGHAKENRHRTAGHGQPVHDEQHGQAIEPGSDHHGIQYVGRGWNGVV